MKLLLHIAAWAVLLSGIQARADDAFYRVPVPELKFTDGALPKEDQTAPRDWRMYGLLEPYAVLDGPGEAYLTNTEGNGRGFWGSAWSPTSSALTVRAEAGATVGGVLVVPKSDWSGMVPLRFTIAPAAANPEARDGFFAAKESHYDRLHGRAIPGAAWFRRQAIEAHRAQGKADEAENLPRPTRDIGDTYDLFTGGRALSENLQLSRDLPPPRREPEPEEKPVPVASIEGITVRSMDWPAPDPKTVLDPLGRLIPADQHAVFFASFDALMALTDETTGEGLPVFRSAMETSVDGRLVERYQMQLCLRPTALARLLGPKVVKSVAITGSDPYFPTGTDVAVLFEATDAAGLREMILAQVRASAAAVAGLVVSSENSRVDGLGYDGVLAADRSVCSYVSVLGNAVVVTNSLAQLKRLAAVGEGKAAAIASLPEYTFFRARYPRDGAPEARETGFVFLSDATIRRWCGPEWRIGASRRLRAAAIMADVAAAHQDELVSGVKEPHPVASDMPMRTIGTLTLGPAGVASSVYGSLNFVTPIAELGITEVAPDEAASYGQWRDGYQRNWNWAFDPIAVSFSIDRARLAADMTVMPLIVASQYRTWIEAARGASVAPGAGDPHDSIAHGVVAINAESGAVKQASGMARMFAPQVEIDPLAWLGQSVALYADPDPFWAEMLAASGTSDFMGDNLHRLPIALYAEVSSALKLTAFVAAARGFIEQSAPGMTAWENREHAGQAYVRVGLTEKARAESGGGAVDNLTVCYAATPRALIVSLSEEVLKRAIERQAARVAGGGGVAPRPAAEGGTPSRPWLGTSLCVQATRQGLELIGGPGGATVREAMQRAAWSNLPILNEWKRRYPDRDPVRVHQERWGVRLVCPGAGEYRWNDTFRTMESSVYGHPGEPGAGPPGLGPLSSIEAGNFGLTFEEKGLRARGEIERRPARPPAK